MVYAIGEVKGFTFRKGLRTAGPLDCKEGL